MTVRASLLIGVVLIGLGMVAVGCGGGKSLADESARELFDTGVRLYDQGKYYRAIEYFQTIVYNFPGDPIIDSAQYYLGLSYFGNKDYQLAGAEFNRLVLNYPSSPFFEHAVFMKAVCFFESTPGHYGLDQTELQQAIKGFEDFIIDFPESELVADARQYLLVARTRMARKYYEAAVVYSRMNAYEAAKIYCQKVVDDYTDTEYGARAAYLYAEMEYKLRRFDQAHQRFRDFTIVYPDHKLKGKAAKTAIEAAFKSAEQAFDEGNYTLAAERFSSFQQDYPNNGLTEKAGDYLSEIREITRRQSANNDTGS